MILSSDNDAPETLEAGELGVEDANLAEVLLHVRSKLSSIHMKSQWR